MTDASIKAGEWVDKAMKSKGLNQTQLARSMGVRPGYISQIVNGRRNISIEVLFRVFEACGLEITNITFREKVLCP